MQNASNRMVMLVALAIAGVACNQSAPAEQQAPAAAARQAAVLSNEWTVFPASALPENASANDGNSVELGFRFTPTSDGLVKGVRFFKSESNTGTHVGNLWDADGNLLATVTFANETATGWQEARFASAVEVSANTEYVVSYHAPVGHYAYTHEGFADGYDAQPLVVPTGGGVYKYGATSAFPNEVYLNSDYGVDVLYTPSGCGWATRPGNVEAAASGASTVDVTWWGSSEGCNEQQHGVSTYHVYRNNELVGTLENGETRFRDTGLAANTTYRYSVRARDSWGDLGPSSLVAEVTTGTDAPCTACSLWTLDNGPDSIDATTTPAEYGLKFVSDVAGTVTKVRFYKGMTDSAAHVGHLWAADGTLLGTTVTSSGENAWGWQELAFTTPVAIAANTTYVVSYYAPTGYPAASYRYFQSTGIDSPPLHAPSSPDAGGNGVRLLGSSGFPTSAYYDANFWVDVVFAPN